MILLAATASAQCAGSPLVVGAASITIAHESDLHADAERHAGVNEWGLALNRGGDGVGGVAHMGAAAYLWTGDLSTSTRQSDTDGNGTYDCSVDPVWTSTCPYPSPWLGTDLQSQYTTYGGSRPVWALEGNHDGSPIVPALSAMDTDDEWWRTYIRPLATGVIDEGPGYLEVELQFTTGTWVLLLLSDRSLYQDRAIGGRASYTGTNSSYSTDSTYGWPEGTLTQGQYDWLTTATRFALAHGWHVLVASHQPPAKTTVLTGAAGDSYADVCSPGGIRVQDSVTASHHPRDATLLPTRTDLDGSPSARDVLRDWSAALLGPATTASNPDVDWWATWWDAIRASYPSATVLWLSGHNHLPVPDLTHTGGDSVSRGTRWDYHGATVLQVGALSPDFCTTASACPLMAALLVLDGAGTWSWTRWDMGSASFPAACAGYTSATIPGGTHIAAYGGISAETGP